EDRARKILSSRLQKLDAQDVERILDADLTEEDSKTARTLAGKKVKNVGKVLSTSVVTFTPNLSSVLDGAEPIPAKPVEKIEVPLSSLIICADACDVLSDIEPECFDAIITDWPYGINMANLEQDNIQVTNMDNIRDTHQVDENIELWKKIVPLFHR